MFCETPANFMNGCTAPVNAMIARYARVRKIPTIERDIFCLR